MSAMIARSRAARMPLPSAIAQPSRVAPTVAAIRSWQLQGLSPQRAGAVPHNDAQGRRVHQALPASRSTKGVSSHPPLRATGQRWLQGQHCARQEADGRPNAGDRSAGSARHGRSAHHDRSSPVVPLLWRPHDHCRGLCARRRTARSPVLRPRHQNRNPMRLATTSLHHPLAGAPRSRRRATVISATANSDATPRAVPKSRCRARQRRPIRDRQRQFALNDAGQRLSRPSRCPIKSP